MKTGELAVPRYSIFDQSTFEGMPTAAYSHADPSDHSATAAMNQTSEVAPGRSRRGQAASAMATAIAAVTALATE